MNFEPIQLAIINSDAKNQLVSAGAGSGKTTVMIEKIANLIIEQNVPISSLLVVTFTVLASNEMKERLIAKLKERILNCDSDTTKTPAEIEQLKQDLLFKIDQVQTASIDTIDGFNAKTIKKYFYELELNPNMEIISDTTRDYYINRALKQAVETISADQNKINVLLDLFGGNARNLSNLEQQIIDIYNSIINLEDYESFLRLSKMEYLTNEKSAQIVNAHIIEKCTNLLGLLKGNLSIYPADILAVFNSNIAELSKVNKALTLKANLIAINTINFSTFTTKQVKEFVELDEINDQIKQLKDYFKKLQSAGIDENYDLHNEEITTYFGYVLDLLKLFMQNYEKIKAKNNLMDFNDMSRLMLKLLKNEKIRTELQAQYKYIFIDEYQDVNPLQDKIMAQIAGQDTQIFTVGDVKQSIYGFRGSSPEWFLNKYDSFKTDTSTGTAFDMNINYRSNPVILQFINEIFTTLMTKHLADIDYKTTSQIEPRRDDIVDVKPKIMLVATDNEKELTKGIYSVKNHNNSIGQTNSKVYECALVVKTITELINTEIYDAKLKQNRKLTYKDIAILTRSTNDENSTILINMLRQCNVPINLNNKLETSASEGIKLLLSILKCVINIADDVDYLASFYALTGLQMDDFMQFRTPNNSLYDDLNANIQNFKIAEGFKKLELIRMQSYVSTNAELLRFILNDMQVKNYLLAHPYGDKELQLIEQFLNKLSVENSLSLAEFITIIETNVSRGNDYLDMDNEDSVTFQTIHKSKGLEYPVVILFNASKEFSYLRDHDTITFNADIGLGVDYFDTVNRQKTLSLPKYAIKLTNASKGYKEEMRLLYVALTRAKNKLYITGQYPKKLLEEKLKKTSYLNMILSCYQDAIMAGKTDFNLCEFMFFTDPENNTVTFNDVSPVINFVKPNFIYPNTSKFSITFKNSVTGLNSKQSEQTKFETKLWLTPNTQYLVNEDKALIGTHYHKALELLNLTEPYTQNTAFEDVDYDKIRLAHSALQPIVKNALAIKKEADFMMFVPYNSLVKASAYTDKVLVQGVVDLLIEFGDHFDIVDYKFSNLKPSVLKEKYAEQLRLYAMAVEKAYNKPVKNTYIYSIPTGKLV